MHHGKEDKENEPNSRYRNHEDTDERISDGLFSKNDDNGDGNDVDNDEYRNEQMDEEDDRIPDDFFNRNDDNGDNDDAYNDEYRNEQMDEEDEPTDEEDEEPDEEEDEQDIDTTTSELDIPKVKKSALLNEDKSLTNPKAGKETFVNSNYIRLLIF